MTPPPSPTRTPNEAPPLPAALRRDTAWTFTLLGITALAWAMGSPATWVVLASGPATVVFAISALVHARGVAAASGIKIWLWVAIAVGAMSLLGGLTLILARGPIESFEACLDRAITVTAKAECQAQYEKDYKQLIEHYTDQLTKR